MTNEPALDRELAMARVGGDAELLEELAVLFIEEAPKQMAEIREAHARGDARTVERTAHGLKGSVANFGAQRAVDVAFQVEQHGRAGDLGPVQELLLALDQALLVLYAELRQL